MSYESLQQQADTWIRTTDTGYFPPNDMFKALSEEVGEISHELLQQNIPQLQKEISDALFPIICLANLHNHMLTPYIPQQDTFNNHLYYLTYCVGQIARELNYPPYGSKKKKDGEESYGLESALDRALGALELLAQEHDVNLQSAFQSFINKVTTRDKDRFNSPK